MNFQNGVTAQSLYTATESLAGRWPSPTQSSLSLLTLQSAAVKSERRDYVTAAKFIVRSFVGRWSLVVGRCRLVVRRSSVVVGRWSLVGGRWSLIVGRWPLVVGRWSLVVGRWSLVVGRWSLVVESLVRRQSPLFGRSQLVDGRSSVVVGNSGVDTAEFLSRLVGSLVGACEPGRSGSREVLELVVRRSELASCSGSRSRASDQSCRRSFGE